MKLTNEQIERTKQALIETKETLARAQRYSEQFQDKELIDFCKSHIQKLEGMLKPQTSIKDQFRAETEKEIGAPLDSVVFDKAYAKAKRMATNLYGEADMQEYFEETGGSIAFYYKETLKVKDGIKTANRINQPRRG